MNRETAFARLEAHGQEHVLRFWDRLDAGQREALLGQVATLELTAVDRMRGLLTSEPAMRSGEAMDPAPVIHLEGGEAQQARAVGERLLREGKVGVILVAGGQGSRLGYDGPKGAYAIGAVSGASLFFFHMRKVLALEQRFDTQIPVYIMTSEANDATTRARFEAEAYFGLDPSRVFFFTQGMWPALDADGRIILDAPGHIFMGPDGHGGTLAALKREGMLDDMRSRGLSTLFYFQVDNPLVEVADPAFLGIHTERGADISLKVCAKRDAAEGLGVVVDRGGRCAVVEYTELTEEQKTATGTDGQLLFRYGSVAIHVFDFEFLCREAVAALPLHVAHKKVPVCNVDGDVQAPSEPNAYKFEKFIFDVLPDANTVVNLAFDRAEEFSPLKNAEGSDSPETVRRDMVQKFAGWLAACGYDVPRDDSGASGVAIEIDPVFAYDAETLAERLRAMPPLCFDHDILLHAGVDGVTPPEASR